jgi:hypothetical protein
MPTYVYENCLCTISDEDLADPKVNIFYTTELNVPIDKRDKVTCGVCGEPLKRKIAFNGLTWAPTSGGMR